MSHSDDRVGLKSLIYYGVGFIASGFVLYHNSTYMKVYAAAHPQDSAWDNTVNGLLQFFRDAFANPIMTAVSIQLFVAVGVIDAFFKIESRRTSLSLDRLWVFLGYIIAVGPMLAFFLGSMNSKPLAHGQLIRRTGRFEFRPLMYFTLLNFCLLGVMIQTPPAAPRFAVLLALYMGLMVVYLVLPHHAAEKSGPLTVRAIRQSSWVYGACAGACILVSGIAYTQLANTQSDFSFASVVASLFHNSATSSLAIDYICVVVCVGLFIGTDNRLRDDAGAGARNILVILTPIIPAVTLPLYMLHRENVEAESRLDQIEADSFTARRQ